MINRVSIGIVAIIISIVMAAMAFASLSIGDEGKSLSSILAFVVLGTSLGIPGLAHAVLGVNMKVSIIRWLLLILAPGVLICVFVLINSWISVGIIEFPLVVLIAYACWVAWSIYPVRARLD